MPGWLGCKPKTNKQITSVHFSCNYKASDSETATAAAAASNGSSGNNSDAIATAAAASNGSSSNNSDATAAAIAAAALVMQQQHACVMMCKMHTCNECGRASNVLCHHCTRGGLIGIGLPLQNVRLERLLPFGLQVGARKRGEPLLGVAKQVGNGDGGRVLHTCKR